MKYYQLHCEVSSSQVPLVEEVLLGLGSLSIDISDSKNTPIYEPPVAHIILWDEVVLKALFSEDFDIKSLSHYLSSQLQLTHKWEEIPEINWQEECNKNFSLTQFGKKLWVCPSWDNAKHISDEVIHLDPGMAFGTGAHETTRLCLEHLTKQHLTNKTVLDFGSGSGILAIAAKKLGASEVTAVDIDPQAITATIKNAKINNCNILALHPWELKEYAQFDIVIANIIANTLSELYYSISSLVKSNGNIILSGILASQVTQVEQCYKDYFATFNNVILNEWALIYAKKTTL